MSVTTKKRTYPVFAYADLGPHSADCNLSRLDSPTSSSSHSNNTSVIYSEDTSMSINVNMTSAMNMNMTPDQPMFAMDERKCNCLLCGQGPPLILQRESVAWTSIIRVAFYVLHTIYPELPYLSMKTHVSPYILRHWQSLGIDKKGDNVKWKKHILDAIWHGDSFFESGTPVLKQTGVWRLINPRADPWLDSPSSSPVPRRKATPQKKLRGSPTLGFEDLQQEFATSEPPSPSGSTRAAGTPQVLPHITSLLRHVDEFWQSRSLHKAGGSPPVHRRPAGTNYSPYRSPPLDGRFATSISTPSSPSNYFATSAEAIPISPTANNVMNPLHTQPNLPPLPSITPVSQPLPPPHRPIANAPIFPTVVIPASPQSFSPMTLSPMSPSPLSPLSISPSSIPMSPMATSPMCISPMAMHCMTPDFHSPAIPALPPFSPSPRSHTDAFNGNFVVRTTPCASASYAAHASYATHSHASVQTTQPARMQHMIPNSTFQPTIVLPSMFPASC